MEEYTPVILNKIAEEDNPLHLCQDIGLCGKGVQQAHSNEVLGVDECTYGPAYWCASVNNAKQCQVSTPKHFQKQVSKSEGKMDFKRSINTCYLT